MPYNILNLQLFGDEAMAGTGDLANLDSAETSVDTGEQVAPVESEESFDSLIKGKYKDDYNKAVKDAVSKRFKNQKDLQGQIDAIDPMIKALATRYGVQADASGRIPIDALTSKVFEDDSMYEQEAFQRGMNVDDLKQMKALERENAQLKMQTQRSAEQQEWDGIVEQGNLVKEMYPTFDLDIEMSNPQFGRLLATMQKSGFPNPVQTAYEAVHREEIMGGAMRYAVQQTQQKISNSIQSGMQRPQENGTSNASAGSPTEFDPSKLTKEQIAEIKSRAARGERITF